MDGARMLDSGRVGPARDRIPLLELPARWGRAPLYPDCLFLKALVIMIVKRLPTVHVLLAVLVEPTPASRELRALFAADGRYAFRRTWERRLAALPATLPAQIGCLGRQLIRLLETWAARLTPAHVADTREAPLLLTDLSAEVRFLLGDIHDNDPEVRERCTGADCELVTTRHGRYPHQDGGVEVRRVFHELRSTAIENVNGQFTGIFECGGHVPTRGPSSTQRHILGAVFVYQLTLLSRFKTGADLRVGLKAFLRAA